MSSSSGFGSYKDFKMPRTSMIAAGLRRFWLFTVVEWTIIYVGFAFSSGVASDYGSFCFLSSLSLNM